MRKSLKGPRGGTVTLMRPPLPVEFKAASLGSLDPVFQAEGRGHGHPQTLMAAYFDGLERHTSDDVKFGPIRARQRASRKVWLRYSQGDLQPHDHGP